MADYCNTTTDLQRVFSGIETYNGLEIAEDFTLVSGTVYRKHGTGFVSAVLWNGTALEEASSTPSPLSSLGEGEFYYSAAADTLYINDAADPADGDILVGEDWDTLKTACRDKAQQMVDAYLNNKYVTPLIPRSKQVHDTADYEYPIVRATALCTC